MSRILMPLQLKLQEDIPKEWLVAKQALTVLNSRYTKDRNHSSYMHLLADTFSIQSHGKITEQTLSFLGGFVEGEGSINVSMKKQKTAMFGVVLDGEFSLTQHINGINLLFLAMSVFKTGRLSYKSGSTGTLVYRIDSRKSLLEKVIPFYRKYVNPYGAPAKVKKTETFAEILSGLENGDHKRLVDLQNKLIPLWSSMRVQTDHKNASFDTSEEVIEYIEAFFAAKAATFR